MHAAGAGGVLHAVDTGGMEGRPPRCRPQGLAGVSIHGGCHLPVVAIFSAVGGCQFARLLRPNVRLIVGVVPVVFGVAPGVGVRGGRVAELSGGVGGS